MTKHSLDQGWSGLLPKKWRKSNNIGKDDRPISHVALEEVKNSLFDRFCSYMASCNVFDIISHEHLVVGHTHEDVGAFLAFSVLLTAIDDFLVIDWILADQSSSILLLWPDSKMLYLDWYLDSSKKGMKMCRELSIWHPTIVVSQATLIPFNSWSVLRQCPQDIVAQHGCNIMHIPHILVCSTFRFETNEMT